MEEWTIRRLGFGVCWRTSGRGVKPQNSIETFDWLLSLGEGPIFFVCWNTCIYRCLSVVCVRLKKYFFEKFHSRIIELYICNRKSSERGRNHFPTRGIFDSIFEALPRKPLVLGRAQTSFALLSLMRSLTCWYNGIDTAVFVKNHGLNGFNGLQSLTHTCTYGYIY